MKLMSPQQVKDSKAKELAVEVLRAKETQEVTKKINQDRVKAEIDFQETLARTRHAWAKEQDEHREDVIRRKKEIDELEAKKLNALIPIGILKERAYEKMQDATKFLDSLTARERNVENKAEILQDRLDEVGERESIVSDKEHRLKLRELGISSQEILIKQSSENLSLEMANFLSEKQKTEKDIDERKTAIFLRDTELEAKDHKLKRKEKELANWEKQLIDQRETLDRAWKELERKKAISP